MSARRPLAVLVLVLFVAVPASAAVRRRAVRSAPALAAASCHTFGLVRPGLVASYHSTTNQSGGDADFTITWITDTPTFTQTRQRTITAQGTADAETRLDGEVFGALRGLKHLNVKTTVQVPVIGAVATEADINFVPTLTQGPAAGWCVGYTWTVPPVTETIVSSTPVGQQSQVITTVGSTGEVLAVNETVSVPAGNFQTVKYRGALVSGTSVQTAITWVSMQLNIVVRQDTIENGTVTSTTVLTAVQ
jgi:hypothetical protein